MLLCKDKYFIRSFIHFGRHDRLPMKGARYTVFLSIILLFFILQLAHDPKDLQQTL